MLDGASIGLKVDVDTLRGTREGVPRLAALFKKHGVQATFYFSVGPDHTGCRTLSAFGMLSAFGRRTTGACL